MKADKAFYNTLRAEVSKGEFKHALCLFAWSRMKGQEKTQALPRDNSESIEDLQERIRGLQSQVELLEKRNQELTEKNKELEAIAYPDYQDYEISDKELEEWERMNEEFENARAEQYRRGYISLKEIAKWGNEGTANVGEARLIKEMIRDIMPVMTEEEKELVKNIGTDYKKVQPPLPPIDKVGQLNLMTGSNPQALYRPESNK